MDAIKRLFGYVHVILGLAVAVQFLASEMYDDDAVVALVFSYLRARKADRSDMSE